MHTELNGLVAAFKALGDPVRLRLFHLLSNHHELCVCHLTDALALPQSTVSRHLGVMRHAGLVITRRDSKWMYYRLNDGLIDALTDVVRGNKDPILANDLQRLAAMLEACSA